jgi:hypothetical protein
LNEYCGRFIIILDQRLNQGPDQIFLCMCPFWWELVSQITFSMMCITNFNRVIFLSNKKIFDVLTKKYGKPQKYKLLKSWRS